VFAVTFVLVVLVGIHVRISLFCHDVQRK